MKKRGQLTLFVAIALILAASIFLITFLKKTSPPEEQEIECQTDSDCVPAECCHPVSCTSVLNAPNCTNQVCTTFCEPGTLDCGQGSCACEFNKCKAVFP